MNKIKVGVFDSGFGGKSVANAISKELENVEVIYVNDQENVPYGNKSPEKLLELVLPILNGLVEQGCRVIVIACNTVTTTIINQLRESMSVPLVGIEPMVKPAAQKTKTGVIAVCATPSTLASSRYGELKNLHASKIKVIEPDCSEWAAMIESNNIDHQSIEKQITSLIDEGADVIVLGCTHYHWIRQEILDICQDKADVIQPEAAIVKRLKTVLSTS